MLVRSRSAQRGFSLIELIMVFVIIAFLTVMAIPMIGKATKNAETRTVAESIQNAVRTAQQSAVQQSRQTIFVLTNATPAANAAASTTGTAWYVQTEALLSSDAATMIKSGNFTGLTSGVSISGPSAMCFNSIGRPTTNASPGPTGASCTIPGTTPAAYNVTNGSGTNMRRLRVTVTTGGQVRMCDPDKTLSSANPDGC